MSTPAKISVFGQRPASGDFSLAFPSLFRPRLFFHPRSLFPKNFCINLPSGFSHALPPPAFPRKEAVFDASSLFI